MIFVVEGPAGSGKSTMAQIVAAELHATVIEGGAWYRALTYCAQQKDIAPDDTAQLIVLAKNLNLRAVPQVDGRTRYFSGDEDMTPHLYEENVSTAIAPISQNLEVRAVIRPQIVQAARQQALAIVVGRHIKQALPEASVLRITINDQEADNRHLERQAGRPAVSVKERNIMDKKTGQLLDPTGTYHSGAIDVSTLSKPQQADLLREFIQSALDR